MSISDEAQRSYAARVARAHSVEIAEIDRDPLPMATPSMHLHMVSKVEARAIVTCRVAYCLGLERVMVPRVRRSSIKLKQRPQEPQAGGREGLSSGSAAPISDHPLLSSPLAIGCSR